MALGRNCGCFSPATIGFQTNADTNSTTNNNTNTTNITNTNNNINIDTSITFNKDNKNADIFADTLNNKNSNKTLRI